MELRLLTEDDAEHSALMSAHAFGMPPAGRSAFTLGPDVRRWGLFDGPVLAAKANERSYDSMIGGRRMPTAGVAGVAVAPEYRGTGLARQVMTHLLRTARDRGAVVATLFRTAPALYRSLGFEQIAELVHGSLPTAALRGIRSTSTTLRRAAPADAPAMRGVYRAVAEAGSCLLTRDGPAFPEDSDPIGAFDGVTLAQDDTGVVGYAAWNRGTGYGPPAVLEVVELLATTGDSHRALLSAVATFESVTPTVHLRTSGDDPVHWLVPGSGWAVRDVQPYMLRVLDAAAAVAARGWPPGAVVDTVIELDDPVCPWNTGRHRLVVLDGSGQLEPADETTCAATHLALTAVAVLFAGGVSVASLRRAGLVTGGDTASDAALDAAFAGPRPAILDSF